MTRNNGLWIVFLADIFYVWSGLVFALLGQALWLSTLILRVMFLGALERPMRGRHGKCSGDLYPASTAPDIRFHEIGLIYCCT